MNTIEEIKRFDELELKSTTYLSRDRFDTLIARGYRPEEIYAEDLVVPPKPSPPPVFSPGELEEYQKNLHRAKGEER